MFDNLQDKFDGILQRVRGERELTEENIKEAVREVRLALLDADVNFKVVREFIGKVREKAVGAEVLKSVRAGQMFTKIVHEELVDLMGGEVTPFELPAERFSTILMLGLQGSGKTTFSGKLALRLKNEGRKPLLIACDIHRPAAINQLHVVGKNIDVPVFDMGTDTPADQVAAAGIKKAHELGCDVAIVDTAGRLHVDEVKMDELQAIKDTVTPRYSFFVADSMTGQDAVNSAERFGEGIGFDGVCLTKTDGDARGGAALSVRAVTGKPIYFIGIGEKSEDLEPFHPDRMAQRILGMGDVVSLVEKAQSVIDEKQAEEMQEKIRKENFSLQDFLDQMEQMKKMGSMKSLLGMLPGMGQALKDVDISDDDMVPMRSMIHSMTPWEREHPEALDGSRRKRIAAGSGRTVAELKEMLDQFQKSRKMMSQMMKMMGGSKMGMLKGLFGGGMKDMMGEDGEMPELPDMPAGMPQIPGGAFNQKAGGRGALTGQKLSGKHTRKRKTNKDRKKQKKKNKARR